MKPFRSAIHLRIIFLVLVFVLSAGIADIFRLAACSRNKIPVIENSTPSAVLDAERSSRTKPSFPGIVFACVSPNDTPLSSGYAFVRMPYPSPKDLYLPAESQRGPPFAILS